MADQQYTVAEIMAALDDPTLTPKERAMVSEDLKKAMARQYGGHTPEPWKQLDPNKTTSEHLRGGVKGIADTGAMVGGFLPPPYNIPAVGAARFVSRGAETLDPVEALKAAAVDMGIEAATGGGAGKVGKRVFKSAKDLIPQAFTRYGLMAGGVKDTGLRRKAADAISAQWNKLSPQLPGTGGADQRIARLGNDARAVTDKAPGSIDIRDTLTDAAQNVYPKVTRVGQQTATSNASKATDQIDEFFKENVGRLQSRSPRASASELGDIKRAQSSYSQGLPGSPHDITDVQKEVARAISDAARKDMELLAPGVAGINKEMAGQYAVKEANDIMGLNSAWIGSPQTLAMRGGLGAGLGMTTSDYTTGNKATGAALGSLAGLGLLTPKPLTIAGQVAGRGAGLTPTALRLMELIEGLNESGDETLY